MNFRREKVFFILTFISFCFITGAVLGGENLEKHNDQDNQEIKLLFQKDQGARNGFLKMNEFELKKMIEEDEARRKRVYQICSNDGLKTGNDFYCAAMVFQHGSTPEDYLFAHELAVIAISKGNKNAIWLAAATEDRFLKSINRKQRFGTQFSRIASDPFKLDPIDEEVSDTMRKLMNCPTLSEALKMEESLNQGNKK